MPIKLYSRKQQTSQICLVGHSVRTLIHARGHKCVHQALLCLHPGAGDHVSCGLLGVFPGTSVVGLTLLDACFY